MWIKKYVKFLMNFWLIKVMLQFNGVWAECELWRKKLLKILWGESKSATIRWVKVLQNSGIWHEH